MSATSFSGRPAPAPRALGEDRRRAFETAARHSRAVRRLRVALPVAGVLLAVGIAGLGILSRIEIALSFGDLAITAEGLSMDAPQLSGSDGKGRTYAVTANRAVQDLSDPKVIRLYGIAATIVQASGESARFSAATGVYDARVQTLRLEDDIAIRASDGTAAALESATIDLDTGDVTSSAPVAFSSSMGSIEAKGMAVGEKGGAVTFGGGVKMTLDPKAVKDGRVPLGGDETEAGDARP